MDTRQARRVLVGDTTAIPDGGAVRVPAERTGTGADIAVFNDGGRFSALDDTCTHGGASLAEGWVEDGEVECPMHSGRFCIRTGEALELPASRDATPHEVAIDDGQVWLMPAGGGG